MPRAKGASASASGAEQAAVAAFLRGLAQRAEVDAAFAAQVHAVARDCGLLEMMPRASAPVQRGARATKALPPGAGEGAAGAPLDPFVVLREREETGLRAALAPLDLPALRAIIRAHRLDSARVSARWTARERLVDLIVDQVRARANHGRAFERV